MADLSMRPDLAPIKLPPVLAYIMGLDIAPRASVERMIQAAIDALDALDGDPDLGPDGDELDGTGAEDDFCSQCDGSFAPGCPVSDPGGCEHDGREEQEELTPDYGIDQTKSLPDAMVIASDRAGMRVGE